MLLKVKNRGNVLLLQLGELSNEKILQNTNYYDVTNNSAERIDLNKSKIPCGNIFARKYLEYHGFM